MNSQKSVKANKEKKIRLQQLSKNSEYTWLECHPVFMTGHNFGQNMERIHLAKISKCNARSSKSHSKNDEEIDPPPPQTFTCYECHKVYSSRRILRSHMELRHPNNGSSSPRFNSNQQKNTSPVPSPERFSCPECHKEFSSRSHLQTHIELIHSKGSGISSINHAKKGEEVQPLPFTKIYRCPKCHHEFQNESCFRRHIQLSHSNCPGLHRSHYSSRGNEIHSPSQAQETHRCPGCQREFRNKFCLNRHMQMTNAIDFSLQECIPEDCYSQYWDEWCN